MGNGAARNKRVDMAESRREALAGDRRARIRAVAGAPVASMATLASGAAIAHMASQAEVRV
jgi:hypothetical protein